jgi:hypothetical protein
VAELLEGGFAEIMAALRGREEYLLLVFLSLDAATLWFYTRAAAPPAVGSAASGTIEADEVHIAVEVAVRVARVLADQGTA